MKSSLATDPQAEITPLVRQTFEFSKLRSALNTLGTAFDEDTQRGTDRIARIILQDVTELETSSKIKPGIPRSSIRLKNVTAKLEKLDKAFGELISFVG